VLPKRGRMIITACALPAEELVFLAQPMLSEAAMLR